MTLHHAYLIKGWLLDKNPPEEVTEALQAIMSGIVEPSTPARAEALLQRPALPAECEAAPKPDELERSSTVEEPKPRKGKGWSPEQRSAAADRLRARQENGGLRRRQQPDPTPGEAGASPSGTASDAAESQTW